MTDFAIKNPDAFMDAAMLRLERDMRDVKHGSRNVTARAVFYRLGTLIHLTNGSAEAYESRLRDVATGTGIPAKELAGVIRRALRDGRRERQPYYIATDSDHERVRVLRVRRSWIDTPPDDTPGGHADESGPDPEQARAIWGAAVSAEGTPAQAYLERRGIAWNRVATEVRYAKSAKYHYCIYPLRSPDGTVVALQRVAIDQHGEPFTFHDGHKRKLSVGPIGDGVFVAMDGEGPPIVAEGPEDALAIAAALQDGKQAHRPVWATMGSVTRCVTAGAVIFADNGPDLPKLSEVVRKAGARLTHALGGHKDAAALYQANGHLPVLAALEAAATPEEPRLVALIVAPSDLHGIAPRPWLYGRKLVRGFVSVLASPGGIGKSAWVAAASCDMAAGVSTLHDMPHAKLRVWIYNLEDPRDETLRKVAAVLLAKNYQEPVLPNIFVNSGRDHRLILAEEPQPRLIIAMPDVGALIDEIKSRGIDVLTVDPFVRSHLLGENDNKSIDFVMDLYAQIANEANCAVLLVHHTRKGFVSGDSDSIRGGSAMTSAARVALTMQAMTPDDAKMMNISDAERRSFVRIDGAKSNLAPQASDAEWIKLVSQPLGNGTLEYPDGDYVQVVMPWSPPDAWDGISCAVANSILDAIDYGFTTDAGATERYSSRPQDDRWAGHAIMAAFPNDGKSHDQCKRIIRTWIENGLLAEIDYMSPTQRKNRRGLDVVKRPGKDGTE